MERSSRIKGFYKLSMIERLEKVKEFADLSQEDMDSFTKPTDKELIDRMVENVVGKIEFPVGVATNFLVNGKDVLVPMAIEEPSVIAAASNAARMARDKGGFHTSSTDPVMIGQIQLTSVIDPYGARMKILKKKKEILDLAAEQDPVLIKFGGGPRDINVRVLEGKETMVIIHLLVDTRDAMGANAVNTMVEALAPFIEELTGGKVYLRILSNLAIHRLSRAHAIFDKEALGGEDVVDGIILEYECAKMDPFRCATHNKGVMNGVSAVVRATGNDTRAVESGAHSYASMSGHYSPLTTWEKDANGDLVGTIEMPTAVGLIGGATKTHPTARACVKITGVKTGQELGEVIAAVGLAQNLGALRALADEGIQKGHMRLHARNIAVNAGATGDEVDKVTKELIAKGKVRVDVAKEILEKIRQ